MPWNDPVGMLVGFFKAGVPTLVEDTERLPVDTDKDEFARILEKRFADTEEVRYIFPASLAAIADGSIYTCVAPDGTAVGTAVWTVVRAEFNSVKFPVRQRVRFNLAFNDADNPTHWT